MCMCDEGGYIVITHLLKFPICSIFFPLFPTFLSPLTGKRGHTWEINMTGGDN